MGYNVEHVSGPFLLGEGPHWDDERQVLYFVDAPASSIGRFDPATNSTFLCKLDDNEATVAIVIPVKGQPDKFIATIGPQLVEVTWDGESSKPDNIRVLTKSKNLKRFNDGKVDPTGRLWIGTMGDRPPDGDFEKGVGNLYSFDKNFSATDHVGGLTIANGLTWSKDLTTMYYIDTPTKTLDAFDYDPDSGIIGNRRVVFDFSTRKELPELSGPDGMTIDTDGNLWVAVFGGSGVYNINPTSGELIRKIDIPSPHTTSVAFGGPERDELYVVSAKVLLPPELQNNFPLAGYTFKVTGLGVKGDPMLPLEIE